MKSRFWIPALIALPLLATSCNPSRSQPRTVASAPAQPLAQQPQPAAAWTFDEGTATTANGAGGNNGALQSGAGWAAGLVGPHALNLPENSKGYVEAPNPVIDTTKSYTVTGWVKFNRLGGFQTIASIDGQQVSGFFLQLRGDSGHLAFTVLPADDSAETNHPVIATASGPPAPNAWYHVAGVYNAEAHTIALYVNGVLQQTQPLPATWHAGGPTAIGRGKYNGNPVDFVNGQIDDVRFYQAALDAPGILAMAKAYLPTPQLQINAGQITARMSPLFYGLMTEEINYSYDGGVYAELIRNRIFKDDPNSPIHWSIVQGGGGAGTIALDNAQPISNTALTTCLKLNATAATGNGRVGAANDGYWGIPVKPNTSYRASFYAKASDNFSGPLSVTIENNDGTTTFARAGIARLSSTWQKYTVTLTTGSGAPSTTNRFVISMARPGTVWLNLVSLFPPTFNNRPNGNRVDLMQRLGELRPGFLRFPGGNYLEGNTIAEHFDWKKTLGPLEQRTGHQGPWGYRSTDGMGLLEFLQWCDDLHMEPLLAVFGGYALGGEHIAPGPALQPFVQDALDEIEYLTGGPGTTWGARRIRDGHPAPFRLHYVEIGNEDWFDRSGSYDGRYTQFYDAIKAKYPALQLIATAPVRTRTPDVMDDHFYRTPEQFEADVHHYDNHPRNSTKVFVGEWASQEVESPWTQETIRRTPPTPGLRAAIGDAVWMTGMERNSDVVVMHCYAPLLVNVNPGGRQWAANLIGYDALNNFASPAFYAQKMFSLYHGDVVLQAALQGTSRLYQSVTRDSRSGTIFVKVVNMSETPQSVKVTLQGVTSVSPNGEAVVLTSANLNDTNTMSEPNKVVPITSPLTGLSPSFQHEFPPHSLTVLQLQTPATP